ncbi:carboxypeptidase B-like [Sitodiplosis mosellana]|uniref:carboxypeptidase B-like n=1 Tax=Sitodiplosis mosellana TaxID=263140 RepID=UPI002444C56F|nr:carboxypeptidase B-like [Sitodiplosis mosellana]
MERGLLFAIFAVLSLLALANAAPSSINEENFDQFVVTPVRYDGDQMWSVSFTDDQTRKVIKTLNEEFDVTLWANNHAAADVLVKQSAVNKVREVLEDNNIQYSVQIEDLQKLIELEALPSKQNTATKLDHPLTWTAYHSTEDIFKFLDYLVEKYPNLCSLQTIGYSVENRPLKVLKISNGNSGNKAIWIDGGIHAREWISPASVTYIVNELVENWESQPDHIKNVNWYVLPVHNPDGYEYTRSTNRMWRKNRSKGGNNCFGVDLNRNYGYKWGGEGTSSNPCSDIYRGSKAFSEPESAAVKNFFDNTEEKKFGAFLTFHSYGQWILHPWGYGNVLPDDHEDLARVGKEGAKKIKELDHQVYTPGNSAALLYPAAGASDDWGKSIGIKYSYTIELRDTGRYGFVLPPEYIEATAKEALSFVFTVSGEIAN